MGILPGHAALLAELGAGALSSNAAGRRRSLTDHVRLLANRAEEAG